jgi:methyl-accepting chemotaxis protein
MRFSLSRLSVTYQFILLAALGVILTVMAVFLTLQRTFDFAYTLKHQEIRHEAEEGASIVRQYVQLAQSGAMTKQEAQSRAIAALKAIRFEGVNYVAILGFDGLSIENANKKLEEHNIINLKDKRGQPVTRKQLAIATSGNPGFCGSRPRNQGVDLGIHDPGR